MYQLIQLSPKALKLKRKAAKTLKEKHLYQEALFIRSLLIVLFAIIFIAGYTFLFGGENSSVAVGAFCMLLGIRFIPYGYEIKESLASLAIALGLMFLGSFVKGLDQPVLSLGINFVAIFIILFLTSQHPLLGNGGIYTFSYLFISYTSVSGEFLKLRFYGLLFTLLLCGTVLVRNHGKKFQEVTWRQLLTEFSFKNPVSHWQLRLALGVSSGLFLGEWLGLEKVVWVGYACMSVLLPFEEKLHARALLRVAGVGCGSLLWLICYPALPEKLIFLVGPIAGLWLGFSATYFWTTVLNCFGGLLLASSLYGITPAVFFRIENNFLGSLYALLLFFILEFLGKLGKTGKEKGFLS